MSVATHRHVHLLGNSSDRRRRLRALKKEFSLTPFEAICAVPKQPYLSHHPAWPYVLITTPGQ